VDAPALVLLQKKPRQIGIPLEKPVMVPGDENLVGMRLGGEPAKKPIHFIRSAAASSVTRMDEYISIGNAEALVGHVSV